MGKKICVIGGAGYIGSELVRSLVRKNQEVRVIDMLLFGGGGLSGLEGSIELIEKDIRMMERSWLEDCWAVINLAGFSNDPTANFRPDLNWDLNVTTAAKVGWFAAQAGVERLIYASSASIYHTTEMEMDSELGEKAPVRPHWHYSTSKFAGEMASLCFADNGLCVTALRKGTVCGPSARMRYDLLLNTMFRSMLTRSSIELHGGGWVHRPLVSVIDAVSAYEAVLVAPESKVRGQIFNVVGENATVRHYAETLVSRYMALLAGRKSPWPLPSKIDLVDSEAHGELRSYKVSSRKLKETLAWRPVHLSDSICSDLCLSFISGGLSKFDDESCDNIISITRRFPLD